MSLYKSMNNYNEHIVYYGADGRAYLSYEHYMQINFPQNHHYSNSNYGSISNNIIANMLK